MDGISTWSAFEEKHQHQKPRDGSSSRSSLAASQTEPLGIDALYVSPSSTDIAPSATALIRQSALAATASTELSNVDQGQDHGEREFQLRFHWMRPHPHLAFSALDEAREKKLAAFSTVDGNIDVAAESSSRMVDAYYHSQWNKRKWRDLLNGNNDFALDADPREEEDTDDVQGTKSDTPQHVHEQFANRSSEAPTHSNIMIQNQLPSEFPKLRINLANLVEPPLMSSWLPGDIEISYDNVNGEEGN
mmetsp:Transcript_15255/g.32010  ORF Transcript_15255/g.32010 Transcript_15255/m.32010 type:complete len:247 (+) Transcript_15255:44-784(+)